ncbi:MAG TPA: transposase [Thermoflexia bacterium]|nr:transposase [Thermoflexia bacterium]
MSKPSALQYGQYYHIYNRGNNRENIFIEERNYPYFLELYARYIEPIADTYAYCLLRNHFHFLVQVKTVEEQETPRVSKPSQQFGNLFNAYAKAINKTHDRTGSLFQNPFGRAKVASDAHLLWLVVYIHLNPQRHGFVNDFRAWTYSSYQALVSAKPTRLRRDDVLSWFDGLDGFKLSHQQDVPEYRVASLVLEDFV